VAKTDQFVSAAGRDAQIKEVRKRIDELGIEYLYMQFVSVTGRICGKGIPADHWESVAAKGFQLVYGATVNLFTNRHGEYMGYGPEAAELVGIPEPETFCQLPWDKRVGRFYCTLFRNREEREEPGAFLTSDCRGNLRRIHEQFQKDHKGLHLRCGTEPEMMWLKKGEDGKPDGGFSEPYCYHIDQFESLRPVYMKVIEYCRFMGLDMIQGDHEDAPGQLELNWNFDDVLRNADRLTTYRQICAQVAREFGLIACFMTKPFMGDWWQRQAPPDWKRPQEASGFKRKLYVHGRWQELLHAGHQRQAVTRQTRPECDWWNCKSPWRTYLDRFFDS